MRAIVLSIGDELVLGQTVDSNAAWISQQLASVGCAAAAHLTVADDQRAIETAMLESVGRCDLLLVSGGIGPTDDDLTRQALAAVMGVELELNAAWLARLEAFYQQIGRPMSALNRIQAMAPRGATLIENTAGTAGGIDATYVGGDQKTICRIFVMPGVPREMKLMFGRNVLPHLRAAGGGAIILSRALHTFGLGESAVAEKLGELMRRDRNPSVGTTVAEGIVSLRLNARFPDAAQARRQLDETDALCRAALGDLIFGADAQTLAEAAAAVLAGSGAAPATSVATAESCTGGLIAKLLTDVAGSSAYFSQGWVTYSNEAKMRELGVGDALLARHGAVSEPTATAMAEGARDRAGSVHGIGVTGIAGPGGGSYDKPVGTVCIAVASTGAPTLVRTFVFPGDRNMVRDRSAKMALTMLRFRLLGQETPY